MVHSSTSESSKVEVYRKETLWFPSYGFGNNQKKVYTGPSFRPTGQTGISLGSSHHTQVIVL